MTDIERREFRPCEKCGEVNPKVSYRRSSTGLACRSTCDTFTEHFHLQCSRCDYLWMTAIEEPPRQDVDRANRAMDSVRP